MLHAAHRLGDQAAKVRCLKALDNSIADQLSAAALKFTERDYLDAVNIYKQIIVKNRSALQLATSLPVVRNSILVCFHMQGRYQKFISGGGVSLPSFCPLPSFSFPLHSFPFPLSFPPRSHTSNPAKGYV